MINVLGIDHPLVCVRDLPTTRELYGQLGFRMKGIGKHPWGTSTCAIIFKNSLLELMGIYDTSLLDSYPAGNFRFGRFVHEAIEEREGVALTALYSDDAERDAAAVEARGGVCQGTIEFGRDVVLVDGTPDRTSTTLKILENEQLPRLSNFACQQHKRHLIEFPEWMDHPNSAYGFTSVSILAEKPQQKGVLDWLSTIHGHDRVSQTEFGFSAQTGNGEFLVMDRESASERYGRLPDAIVTPDKPYQFALDLKVRSMEALNACLATSPVAPRRVGERAVLSDAARLGGVILSFVEIPEDE
ncbi:VOC family protein [Rhizobium sp. PRIMUS64]|uniref:VOC family protein n=1 Tax=Rhizobium sp. PRIMUS64 TaxID=2908925 RepID=UPI001FF2C4FA|nr:VOC family protein [Rhizobium sp. PRIMUS64]MCJ9690547.1 VOC family protein [Rhizobium sp. PRIMUS64]